MRIGQDARGDLHCARKGYRSTSGTLRTDADLFITRPAQWPQDVPALSVLDTSFVTDRIYRLTLDGLSFGLEEDALAPPLHKSYPFDPTDREEQGNWDHAVVAEAEERLIGFAAAQYMAWNRRTVIWHLYVAPDYRGRGVGTRLLDTVDTFARRVGARCLWLETQNVNVPAVRFYLRSGFMLCGLDTSLYDPEGPAGGEVALFLERPVPLSATRPSP